jgi:exopolysaccharide biosynthesis polyprenyl glycosylphosphotransferase
MSKHMKAINYKFMDRVFPKTESTSERTAVYLAHVILCMAVYFSALLIRYKGAIPFTLFPNIFWGLGLLMVLKLLFLVYFGLHNAADKYSGIKSLGTVIKSISLSNLIFVLPAFFLFQLPLSLTAIDWWLSILVLGGGQVCYQLIKTVPKLQPLRNTLGMSSPIEEDTQTHLLRSINGQRKNNFLQIYPKYELLLMIIDLAFIYISFMLAFRVKCAGDMSIFDFQNTVISKEWLQFIPFSFIMLFYFQYANFYKFQNIFSPVAHVPLVFKTVIKAVFVYIAYQLATKNIGVDSGLYYIFFTFSLCTLLIPVRIYFVDLIRKTHYLMDNVVIIGTGKTGRELLKTFSNKSDLYNIVGFIDDHKTNPVPTIGRVKDAKEISKKHGIQSFILAFDNISRERFFEIFRYFQRNKLVLAVSSDYLNILHQKFDGLDIFEEIKLVKFSTNDKQSFLIIIKRQYDFILSLLGLILLLPFFLVIAVLIKLSSPGPVFYSHVRIGKDGKPFKFYKFRSMKVGSDSDKKRQEKVREFIKGGNNGNSDSTKVVNKQNVTKIGAFLRKHSLDELPQLFNVLKGDMSLVGPRPCLPNEWEVYEDWQRIRFATIPGCTGMWQVYGRSEVSFEESVLMDIYYNQNFTPLLDIKLMLKTVPVLLFGKGGE